MRSASFSEQTFYFSLIVPFYANYNVDEISSSFFDITRRETCRFNQKLRAYWPDKRESANRREKYEEEKKMIFTNFSVSEHN